MRAVIQRVSSARCEVTGEVTGQVRGQIGPGLVVLLGVAPTDTPATAQALAARLVKLRIFNDEAGKMNRSLADTGGAVLSISQFTLFADTSRGNRPSFTGAAPPDLARAVYADFGVALRALGVEVAEGVFGAHMVISLVGDGPVTLTLEL
ncbi:D-aminoacyl-tRNA deacylase [Deinococcus sp.]|uniref:D-aminoacyl-tRNA deacylase n=1 Tax=Deinococcus sp. TaxID=47478 RepID=UPI0025F9DCA1|nr:D-aminoacyl-tRNA deacylase [Deinococcus sp.]